LSYSGRLRVLGYQITSLLVSHNSSSSISHLYTVAKSVPAGHIILKKVLNFMIVSVTVLVWLLVVKKIMSLLFGILRGSSDQLMPKFFVH
jgi:hypothetical protein